MNVSGPTKTHGDARISGADQMLGVGSIGWSAILLLVVLVHKQRCAEVSGGHFGPKDRG